METKGERRAAKARKYGKHRHKTDGAGARLLNNIVMSKAAAAKSKEKQDSNTR